MTKRKILRALMYVMAAVVITTCLIGVFFGGVLRLLLILAIMGLMCKLADRLDV